MYRRLLRVVVIGIAIAIFVEWQRKSTGKVGVGLPGAIVINLLAAAFLTGWLLFGDDNFGVRA